MKWCSVEGNYSTSPNLVLGMDAKLYPTGENIWLLLRICTLILETDGSGGSFHNSQRILSNVSQNTWAFLKYHFEIHDECMWLYSWSSQTLSRQTWYSRPVIGPISVKGAAGQPILIMLILPLNPRSTPWPVEPAQTLQWRHNDHDGVSNHQPHGCLLNRLFRRRSKKTSKLRVTGLCVGNSGEFPAQRASNAENVTIWWRHHERCKDTPNTNT